jgi:aerobic carbon-monoxide dehydrogenase large subunit
MSKRNSYIGDAIERVEDLRFLRGKGQYVDDLQREDILYAVILRSSVPHGRIKGIDTAGATALSGVHSVLTAKDIGSPPPFIPMRLQVSPGVERFWQPVIADSKVRYVGEPVAVVLAETPAIGEDALELINLDIEALPVVKDSLASASEEVLLFDRAGTNCARVFTAVRGSVDEAFRDAAYVRREKFRTHRHMALTMEPRGLLAEWNPELEKLTVFGAAKVPFFNRRILSQLINLPESSIDLIENDVGGGFGARGEFYPEDFLIPFAARHSLRPVKWTEDRREHLMATNHAREMECEIEMACDLDGTLRGLRGIVRVDTGAYLRTNGLTPANNVGQFMSNIHLETFVQLTNKTPCGTYRAPGRFEGCFFFERFLDMVASDLKIDRVEIRRRNLISEVDMPYQLAQITPERPYARTECDSGDYRAILERCLAEFGWHEKSKIDGKLIDGRYHGLGICCFIEGGAAGPKENVRLVLETDGSISVFVGSSALGQGLETVFAQIAADSLALSINAIRGVFHGSTTLVSEGFGSFHSRAVVMGGSAIVVAADKFKERMNEAAAKRMGCLASRVIVGDGVVTGPSQQSITFAELSADGVAAEGTFANSKNTYAYGAHAAHVSIDPRTGHLELVDYVAVEDVGRIINSATLHGQLIGAVVQGLGGTLLEHLLYDGDGQLLTGSLADYLIPSASDFPCIRGVTMETAPSPNNPLGAKGAGEGGIIAVGGAIANAVASALSPFGVQPRELPLSPNRIWHLLNAT